MAGETTTLTSRCLCKTHTFTTTVPNSSLPLKSNACHCDSCRHNTGALYSVDADWPEPRSKVDVSRLKTFVFSSRIHVLFCGTCSTPMFFAFMEDLERPLGVFTGTLENDPTEIVRLGSHIWVQDTKDGGATQFLTLPHETPAAKRYLRGNGEAEITGMWPRTFDTRGIDKAKSQRQVPIKCKCGGVDLTYNRPDYTGRDRELPSFVDAQTKVPQARFSANKDDRLASGVDIMCWTYAELQDLVAKGDEALPTTTQALKERVDAKDAALGSLTCFESASGVQRYFCGDCCACIFKTEEGHEGAVAVALGVIHAVSGARAEGLVAWNKKDIDHVEDAKGGWREPFYTEITKRCAKWTTGTSSKLDLLRKR